MTVWSTSLIVVESYSGTTANPPVNGGSFTAKRGIIASFLPFPRTGASVAVPSIGAGGVTIT